MEHFNLDAVTTRWFVSLSFQFPPGKQDEPSKSKPSFLKKEKRKEKSEDDLLIYASTQTTDHITSAT